MQLATGAVVEGKVVIEGLALPKGTVVRVLTSDEEESVRLPQADEAELLEALDEADRKKGISAEELFARLTRFGGSWRLIFGSSLSPYGSGVPNYFGTSHAAVPES